MILPEPPPLKPAELERVPEDRKSPLLAVLVVVPALVVASVLAFLWLTAPPTKPAAAVKPSPTNPHVRVNPCAHDTFDSNGCAARIIENTAKQYDAAPYAVVQAMCKKLTTPAARHALVDKWVSQGAYRPEARAVLGEFMDYCSRMEEA